MKQTRNLWASVIFVAVLVVASLTGFATGALQPKLGLDLEGGISVILQAPEGTSRAVMNQALESIRKRVDAFGVGEPQIAVSANTIEVQIPGGANGTVQQRAKDQYCLVGQSASNFGCADTQDPATKALAEMNVVSQPTKVCLQDAAGTQLGCYASVSEAETTKAGLTVTTSSAAPLPSVAPTPSASPSAGASVSTSPSVAPSTTPTGGQFCLTDASSGDQLACYPSAKAASAAQKGVVSKTVTSNYCLTAPATVIVKSPSTSASPTPSDGASPSSSPSKSAKATPSGSASAASPTPTVSTSPAPTTKPSAYSQLTQPDPALLPLCQNSKKVADTALSSIAVTHETTEYCVITSANKNLGCYLTKSAAQTKQQETGQDHLLAIIGKTARLEQRQVLSIIQGGTAAFSTTPVTCGTTAQQATKACSFDALRNQKVVYLDQTGATKYQLGPVVISGDEVTKATAVLNTGSTDAVSEWIVDFNLNGDGSKAFADLTTRLANLPSGDPQKQIAIVVDRQVISAPSVNGAITGGTGQISGGFTESQAKDLATVLSAGALPVDLSVQSVTTISPTLGSQSLREGIIAAIFGLVLLFAYMLFYYRLLGVVAITGMTIWAILALALVSLAGEWIGYAMTLAGVAGLVISLGVTTDSYIVFFERLKDEVRSGRSARSAVQPAFKRAYRTIVAADIVTGIAALVLYLTAVSSVRGFALTLGVATLLDLFVVWFFKRPTVFLIARNKRLVELPGFGLESGVAANADPEEIIDPAGEGA
jgi:protein-export membrane protein SecD